MTGNLSLFDEYTVYDRTYIVFIGNGKQLPIDHIGEVTILTSSGPVVLSNVLHVPLLKQNQLSISQFIIEHNCDFCFKIEEFAATVRQSGRVILAGIRFKTLYDVDDVKHCGFFSNTQKKIINLIWHCRLGHCSFETIKLLKQNGFIDFSSDVSILDVCKSCQLAKASSSHFANTVQLLPF